MSIVAVVGAQWGDEGKGKVVELFARSSNLVVQYAGGANPGQTVVAEGERMVFHVIPTGALRQGTDCLLAQGMAIDPTLLLDELEALSSHRAQRAELFVDRRAHVVFPQHILLDELRDEAEGASGAPRRGIGPCYGDKVARRGAQVGDLLVADRLEEKVRASIEVAASRIRELGGEPPDPGKVADTYAAAGEKLADKMVDGSRLVSKLAAEGKSVVLEGPYGAMVDLEMGSYPYIVAASTTTGGACVGVGIAPRAIDTVVGAAKAYSTRSGAGPFPTELSGELANRLQEAGGEIHAITGRRRRVGMFDVPALKYAARVDGFDWMALSKLDVLSGMEEIPLCVGYQLDGEVCDEPPFEGQSRLQPLVEMMPGWKDSLRDCRAWDDLPANARKYIEMIQETSGVRVGLLGVGPDRSESIVLGGPFEGLA